MKLIQINNALLLLNNNAIIAYYHTNKEYKLDLPQLPAPSYWELKVKYEIKDEIVLEKVYGSFDNLVLWRQNYETLHKTVISTQIKKIKNNNFENVKDFKPKYLNSNSCFGDCGICDGRCNQREIVTTDINGIKTLVGDYIYGN